MTEPTVVQVFGAAATQSATLLTLTKSDYPLLTASSVNTAESLAVALLLKWESVLTELAQSTNTDQSIRVVKGDTSIVTDFNNNNAQYYETPFTITLRTPFAGVTIDPDAY